MKADEKRARALVRQRSGGICELCGMARATNFQHRKNRSQGGPWTASNGLDVCGSGTTGCHGFIHHNLNDADVLGYYVRQYEDSAAKPVKLFARGWSLLDDEGGATPTVSPDPLRRAAS